MTITPEQLTGLLIIVIPLVGAQIVNIVSTWRMKAKVDTVVATSAAVEKKADTIIEKAVEIHTLTNSNLSAVTKTLEVAQQKISGLESMVSEMLKTRDATVHATDAVTLERALTATPKAPEPRTPDGRSGDTAAAVVQDQKDKS